MSNETLARLGEFKDILKEREPTKEEVIRLKRLVDQLRREKPRDSNLQDLSVFTNLLVISTVAVAAKNLV